MEEARLALPLVDESLSGMGNYGTRQDACLSFLRSRNSLSTLRNVSRCGKSPDLRSELQGRKFFCRNRWCEVCYPQRLNRAYRAIPQQAFEMSDWWLATFRLPQRWELSSTLPKEMRLATGALLAALPETLFKGAYYAFEVACDQSARIEISPHLHAILATQGSRTTAKGAWREVLHSFGQEFDPKSLRHLADPTARRKGVGYILKRKRTDEPIPLALTIQEMEIFQSKLLTGRTGCFRKPSSRNRSKAQPDRSTAG